MGICDFKKRCLERNHVAVVQAVVASRLQMNNELPGGMESARHMLMIYPGKETMGLDVLRLGTILLLSRKDVSDGSSSSSSLGSSVPENRGECERVRSDIC